MTHKRDEVEVHAGLPLHGPFWRFSLAVYARPGVAEECLGAQTALGLDVNVLLFCAWIGAARAVRLETSDIAALTARVEGWHGSIVKPLRAVRQGLKTSPEIQKAAVSGLRASIASSELRAEQIEQALLFAAVDPAWRCDPAASREEIVRGNVGRCLAAKGGAGEVSCSRLIEAAVAVEGGGTR